MSTFLEASRDMREAVKLLYTRCKATELLSALGIVALAAALMPFSGTTDTAALSLPVLPSQPSLSPAPELPVGSPAEYPRVEDPAFQEGLLSLLAAIRVPKGHFPPKAIANVTDAVGGFGFAPYCYMPSDARRYSERLGGIDFSLDASPALLDQFLMECRTQVFAGQRGRQTAWIVVYDIPDLVTARVPASLIAYRKNNQHLLIVAMHAVFRDEFPAAAEERAFAEFGKPWEK